MSKKHFLWGTLILTCTGLFSRIIGFFYRIFLSHTIGAQGLGLYQLSVPLQTLVLALTTSGLQAAISRLSAASFALKDEKKARDFLTLGTFFSLLLSSGAAFFLYRHAGFFAIQILKEERTLPLLRLLSFTFPLSALHTCMNSFYFARKRTELPSAIQLLEQIVRVGSCYILYLIFLSEDREITAVIAAGGTLASEAAASLASLLAIGFYFRSSGYTPFHISKPAALLRELFHMSLPLTLNRTLLTLLAGIEMILIPQMLRVSGLTPDAALSVYGVFTGMTLPLLLFPSTIINSASVLLMPSVAGLQALGYKKRIRYVIRKASMCCLLLGSTCALLFFFFGKPMGILLFKNPAAGEYIHTMAFICPFLYLNTALSSILNGLGKPQLCLLQSVVDTGIRILFVILAVPVLGIRGYLYGILLSELVHTLLHIWSFSVALRK